MRRCRSLRLAAIEATSAIQRTNSFTSSSAHTNPKLKKTRKIEIKNDRPEAVVSEPGRRSSFGVTFPIRFVGAASDREDGNVPADTLESLSRMPGVVKIEEDRYHENVLRLHDATPLVRGLQSQISGAGLAQAKTMALPAIRRIHSGRMRPGSGSENARQTSAPSRASASRRVTVPYWHPEQYECGLS